MMCIFIGSDNGSITIDVWNDLCTLVGSHDTLNGCNLSLNLIRDSIKLLSSNYVQKRMISGESLYSLLIKEYVPVIGNFIRGLCLGLVERWVEAVSMETADHCAGETYVDLFFVHLQHSCMGRPV